MLVAPDEMTQWRANVVALRFVVISQLNPRRSILACGKAGVNTTDHILVRFGCSNFLNLSSSTMAGLLGLAIVEDSTHLPCARSRLAMRKI